jgi:anti-sigma factor RsiW
MTECDKIRGQLADYVVGGLRGRAQARVEAHLRACEVCQRELAALERTGELLDAVGREEAPTRTWESIRREIEGRRRAPVGTGLRWAWALAVTTAALVLMAFGALKLRQHALEATPQVAVVAEVDEEMRATMEGHLSAVWAAPLSDEAAVGLRLAALEGDG